MKTSSAKNRFYFEKCTVCTLNSLAWFPFKINNPNFTEKVACKNFEANKTDSERRPELDKIQEPLTLFRKDSGVWVDLFIAISHQ